jgi:sporulation protein YlmC with PRC-barrel domain
LLATGRLLPEHISSFSGSPGRIHSCSLGATSTEACARGTVEPLLGCLTTKEANMAMQQETDSRETTELIGSDKVEGTDVYRSNGNHVGEIERVMINKRTGKVAYAVMSFGGFLGIGEDYYPIHWSLLTYNERTAGTR